MTNKQAIDLIHACMHINNAEILEARDKACIALDKQEPKKVIGAGTYHICPCCKKGIVYGMTFNPEYCSKCGQKLDWSDDND